MRIWWTLTGVVLVNWAVDLLGSSTSFWWAGLLTVLGGAWGLAVTIGSLLPMGQSANARRWGNVFAWLTAGLVVVMFFAWAAIQVHNGPGYSTDEMSFDQYAAQIAAHGGNPYVHSMAGAFPLFRNSPNGFTYMLNGHPVQQLSYPTLSFLLYVPFMLVGWYTEIAPALNIAAWGLSILLMFAFLPRSTRALALVLGSVSVYVAYSVGGVTDALYVPLLLVAAYRWDEFGRGRRSYLGPIALGLALAVKQTPWPLLPFMVFALAYDEYDASGNVRAAFVRGRRYLWIALLAFIIPNLPYFVASPAAWVNGTLTPLTQNLIPSGQGIIGLTLFLHLGGGSLEAFTVLTVLVGVLMLVTFVGTYPLLRPVTFLLPAVIFFFSPRSDANYFISLFPVVIVAALSTREPAHPRLFAEGLLRRCLARRGAPAADPLDLLPAKRRFAPLAWLIAPAGPLGPVRSRPWAAGIGCCATLALASLVYALSVPAPLSLRVVHIKATAPLATIAGIKVRVRNTSGSRIHPVFTLQEGDSVTAPWTPAPRHGPYTLMPGHSALYTLQSPNSPGQPSIGGGFSVEAFASSPASISIAHHYLPERPSTAFLPQSFDTSIPVGKVVTLHVELLHRLNQRMKQAGIRVYLGWIIYDGTRTKRARISANGAPPSAHQAVALTNAQGIATFKVFCNHNYAYPVTFSASLKHGKHIRYGYSGRLDIRFYKPS